MIRRLLIALGAAAICSGILADEKEAPLISAGQPDVAQLAEYAEQGYSVILDMRTEGEDRGIDEQAEVESLGMSYVNLPIGRGGISFENAEKLDKLLEDADGPVVMHCGSGNRVGALMALRASANGASVEDALKVGKEFGMTRLTEHVEKILAEQE